MLEKQGEFEMSEVRELKVVRYLDKAREWRARIISGNGDLIAKTRGSFRSEKELIDGLDKQLSKDNPVELNIFQGENGGWYWEGGILISSEGYRRRTLCVAMAALVLTADV